MRTRSQLTDRKNDVVEIVIPSDAGDLRLPRPRRSLLLVLAHDATCADCGEFLERASADADEVASWGCDFLVLYCGSSEGVGHRLAPSIQAFRDAEAATASALPIACPGVLIVDEWRDVAFSRGAGPEHDFPAVAELVSEIRYLGTRCSECEGEAL